MRGRGRSWRAAGLQAAAVAPPLAYDWRGFYVGGHVGAASAKVDSTTIDIATGLPRERRRPAQPARSAAGRPAIISWWRRLAAGRRSRLIGRQHQGQHHRVRCRHHGQRRPQEDLFGTARARVGYASGNWLFYGTGGYAWSRDPRRARRSPAPSTWQLPARWNPRPARRRLGRRRRHRMGVTPTCRSRPNTSTTISRTPLHLPACQSPLEDSLTKDTVKLGVNWRLNWAPDSVTRKY